ncbi:MAG: metal-dependent hydrolase [Promethearchaeota archaeon]
MHANTHLAFGAIIGLIIKIIMPFSFSFLEFSVIVLAACAPDVDFILSRYARSHNHRYLPTHSIFVGLIPMILASFLILVLEMKSSFIFMILFGSINLIGHVLLDSIDWGVNIFMNNKLIGWKYLYGKKSIESFCSEAFIYQNKATLFYIRYYRSKFIIFVEISAFSCMLLLFSLTMNIYGGLHWLFVFLYFILLGYHLRIYRLSIKQYRNYRVANPEPGRK